MQELQMSRVFRWFTCSVALALIATASPIGRVASLDLHENDHIAIIGNTLAERLQEGGGLEETPREIFRKHALVFRNLGFSGDEVATRLRSKNFGTPDEWLSGQGAPLGGYEENRLAGTNTKADVIFAFFGYNESYAGEQGLPAFKQQ